MNKYFKMGFEKVAISLEEKRDVLKKTVGNKKKLYGGNAAVFAGMGGIAGGLGAAFRHLPYMGNINRASLLKGIGRGSAAGAILGGLGGLALGHNVSKNTNRFISEMKPHQVNKAYAQLKKAKGLDKYLIEQHMKKIKA